MWLISIARWPRPPGTSRFEVPLQARHSQIQAPFAPFASFFHLCPQYVKSLRLISPFVPRILIGGSLWALSLCFKTLHVYNALLIILVGESENSCDVGVQAWRGCSAWARKLYSSHGIASVPTPAALDLLQEIWNHFRNLDGTKLVLLVYCCICLVKRILEDGKQKMSKVLFGVVCIFLKCNFMKIH